MEDIFDMCTAYGNDEHPDENQNDSADRESGVDCGEDNNDVKAEKNEAPAPKKDMRHGDRSADKAHKPSPLMLINEVSKLFHDKIRIESEKANLPNSYRQILFHLAFSDGKTQLELAQLTHLKPPTVSVSLQKMENDELVRRVPDENDLRQTHVYITEKGRHANRMMHKKFHEVEAAAMEGLTSEETEQLYSLLCKIRDNECRMLCCGSGCCKDSNNNDK